MRYVWILAILVSTSCNQQLSDEQRESLKAEKANRKIQRITEADILNAAKIKAQKIYAKIEVDTHPSTTSQSRVKWVSLQDSVVSDYEEQVQEAYQYTLDQGLKSYDNIEDLGDGRIAFTRPAMKPDSSQGFWIIMIDKKEIVKGMQ